jgi:hypothetical protein
MQGNEKWINRHLMVKNTEESKNKGKGEFIIYEAKKLTPIVFTPPVTMDATKTPILRL